ncbi:hypothetical protein [Streptomyces huiliensis]|uniref:hypothetical protein n=1 Tax=Streptomyces huiliensis TaxID=2876027 RepID=UPI001CBBB5AB|nr:hypothetical protein [Streptomyces huiliensis]MBZ4321285.1 hypothetical protein [Streptomyces huiliensis]
MSEIPHRPVSNRWADAVGPGDRRSSVDRCDCVAEDEPGSPEGTFRQVWISLHTSGRDVLPLLVNACSAACVDALPTPAEGYVGTPHTGGSGLVQPPAGAAPFVPRLPG